jgi:branched-chain amino acid aminotransferase
MGLNVDETDLTIDEMLNADEVFCTGTAVVVTPIGEISTDKSHHIIGDGKIGSVTAELREKVLNIQSEKTMDEFGWITVLDS